MLAPFKREGIPLDFIFGSGYLVASLENRVYWQIPSSIVVIIFISLGIFSLLFADDLNFEERLWLQRRNGYLEIYFICSSVVLKASQIISLENNYYEYQISVNFLLKWVCIGVIHFTNPIFSRKERIVAFFLAFFNIWLATSQLLKMVV